MKNCSYLTCYSLSLKDLRSLFKLNTNLSELQQGLISELVGSLVSISEVRGSSLALSTSKNLSHTISTKADSNV